MMVNTDNYNLEFKEVTQVNLQVRLNFTHIMNKLILSIILLLSLISATGCDGQTEKHLRDSSALNIKDDSISNELTEPFSDQLKTRADWSNPFLNPFGQNIVKFIRAYYITGQFNKMRYFLIGHNKLSQQQFNSIVSGSSWGYQLSATNLKWSYDSSFIITCKSIKNNTEGMEEYFGVLQNDTAKLMFYPENAENPFVHIK